MRYSILTLTLLILGCGGQSGDSAGGDTKQSADAAERDAATVGAEVADVLNDAQQSAADVEAVLQENKDRLDEELDRAEGSVND